MELVDIFKIVVPIIASLCGTVWATMRWATDREAKAWTAIHAGLGKQITELREELSKSLTDIERRLLEQERDLSKFREKVAEEYIKREDWLQHAVGLEKKVDLLRQDMGKELQALGREVAQLGGRR